MPSTGSKHTWGVNWMIFHELSTHVSAPIICILQLPQDLKLSNFKFILAQWNIKHFELAFLHSEECSFSREQVLAKPTQALLGGLFQPHPGTTNRYGQSWRLRRDCMLSPIASDISPICGRSRRHLFFGPTFHCMTRWCDLCKKVIEHKREPVRYKKTHEPECRTLNYMSFFKRHAARFMSCSVIPSSWLLQLLNVFDSMEMSVSHLWQILQWLLQVLQFQAGDILNDNEEKNFPTKQTVIISILSTHIEMKHILVDSVIISIFLETWT